MTTGTPPDPTPAFQVQGWCPGALRPMLSGDGLVVRLRAPLGRISPAQGQAIAAAAATHGNGLLDLSARGNLQLRGVTPASHPALIADLRPLGLIDADATAEARRNLLLTPFATAGDEALATALTDALTAPLPGFPSLPGKFGFVLDTGPAPVLSATPGDIRLERGAEGGLLIRCDGAALGAPVTEAEAPAAALALARWFCAAGGIDAGGRGRMAALIARGARPSGALAPRLPPAPALAPPTPGTCTPQGLLLGLAFGQISAPHLAALSRLGPLRLTPWRMLLLEGAAPDLLDLPSRRDLPGLILRADDPMARVIACTGAPGCQQALAPVRALAARLAAQVAPGARLHVSGCAKGCAHPGPADLTLLATATGFDLIRQGTPRDPPHQRGLDPSQIDLKEWF